MTRRWIAGIAFLFLYAGAIHGQPPIAYNDTVTVQQFSTDTINITVIDSSPSGDSLCITKIYGSPDFALINCSGIAYTPDTMATLWDSCHYIICNVNDTLLCDTTVLVVEERVPYRPFMLKNSKWVVGYNYGDCTEDATTVSGYDSYVTGMNDTVINNKHYFALHDMDPYIYEYGCGVGLVSITHDTPYLVGFLREDTAAKQVFILYPNVGHDSLLYDFNLSLGSYILFNDSYSTIYDTVYVNQISTWQEGGPLFNQIDFEQRYPGYWVEGFGSPLGLLTPFNTMSTIYDINLLCFSNNDTIIYPWFTPDTTCYDWYVSSISTVPAESVLKFYPNPAINTVTIIGLKPREPIIITNLLGQVLMNEIAKYETQILDISRLAAGMYFVNTMKLVKE